MLTEVPLILENKLETQQVMQTQNKIKINDLFAVSVPPTR